MACLWAGETKERTSHQIRIDQREQDEHFQCAMHRAVRAGKERPPMIGVWRDDTPIGRVTDVPLGHSPMGSPGAMMEAR